MAADPLEGNAPALCRIDSEFETDALDLLRLVESIHWSPWLILCRRLDEIKGEAMAHLLLRHLNSVYEVLSQTVPDGVKTDMVRELELCLRDMLRGIDSSLLDEWEKMRDGNYRPSAGNAEMRPPKPEGPPDITREAKAFTAAIRTRVLAFLRAWSIGDDDAALAAIDSPNDGDGEAWTTARLRATREAYRVEHASLRLDPEARNLRHTYVKPADDGAIWRVQQMLIDPDAHNDWVMELDVDLAASRDTSALVRVGSLT